MSFARSLAFFGIFWVAAGAVAASDAPLKCEMLFAPPQNLQITMGPKGGVHANGVLITGERKYPLSYVLRNLGIENMAVHNAKVLSVGEGTSGLLPFLLSKGLKAEGVDLWYNSESFPEGTVGSDMRKYVETYGSHLIAADARNIPRPSNSYQFIFSHLLINNILNYPARIQIVEEMFRLLAPGGEARIFGFRDDRYPVVVQALKNHFGDEIHIEMTHPTVPEGKNPEQFDPHFANRYWLMKITKVPLHKSVVTISDHDLLVATMSLNAGMNPQHLARPIAEALRMKAGVSSVDELAQPAVLAKLQKALRGRMGNDSFGKSVGSVVSSAQQASTLRPRRARAAGNDDADMLRGWGWKLLPDEDPTFRDPQYLNRVLQAAGGASGVVRNLGHSQTTADSWRLFTDAWKKIAPADVDPNFMQFALTGTDANNLLYQKAARIYQKTHGGILRNDVEILSFEGSFAGSSGRMQRLNLFQSDPALADLRIISPDSPVWEPDDVEEIERLTILEEAALQEIRSRVASGHRPIGGFLLEPVLGAGGVRFYRREFLLKLRLLCDELHIPIFVDEILTGGGRTGQFFSYLHYADFEPDFVSFGKGLQVAGIVQTNHGVRTWGDLIDRRSTLTHYSEILLKATQILDRVREGRLMEQAAEIGRYLVQKIQNDFGGGIQRRTKLQNARIARGLGLLVYSSVNYSQIRDIKGRMTPPLTLTRDDVDRLFGRPVPVTETRVGNNGSTYDRYEGGPVKLAAGSIVEGPIDVRGTQTLLQVDEQNAELLKILDQSVEVGRRKDLSFWDKINLLRRANQDAFGSGISLLKRLSSDRFSARMQSLRPPTIHVGDRALEQAVVFHLMLAAAGFDSEFLGVQIFSGEHPVGDRALVLVQWQGQPWVAGGGPGFDSPVPLHTMLGMGPQRLEIPAYPRAWIASPKPSPRLDRGSDVL